jgi:hypothetical protein
MLNVLQGIPLCLADVADMKTGKPAITWVMALASPIYAL